MSAAAVIDHIRNKGLRGIERDRRAFSRGSCVTEILALDFKSSLRIKVKRRVILYFATSDEFLSIQSLGRLTFDVVVCTSTFVFIVSLFMLKISHLII